MTVLLVDWSTVLYGNIFSVAKDLDEHDLLPSGKYDIKKYKDLVIEKVFTELSQLRYKFDLDKSDKIVICIDNPTKQGYWRRDIWAGYKSNRDDQREKSNIDWDGAYEIITTINDMLECTSFIPISLPRIEGDDIIFSLGKHISENGDNVIIYSSDHDFIQLLKYDNIKFYRTTRTTGMENSCFCEINKEEIYEIEQEHIINGDRGDGFFHIKSYSCFSIDFLNDYPHMKGKESKAYPKRFELERAYFEKTGKKMYSHPRFGYKMMKKSGKTLDEILAENEIYKQNYILNKKLAIESEIPSYIRKKIITFFENYKNKDKDITCLMKKFSENGCFTLSHLIPLL